MSAGLYGWTIEQGANFTRQFTLRDINGAPIDLTGAVAQWSVKPSVGILTQLYLNYESSPQESHIVLGGVAGTITITLSAAETEAITWLNGVYDIFVTFPGGARNRILYGAVSVTQTVTHL